MENQSPSIANAEQSRNEERGSRKRPFQEGGVERSFKRQKFSRDYKPHGNRQIERKFVHRSEEEHGIRLFLSEFPILYGLTKQRRSDFLVREISSNGVVARLTPRDETVVPREVKTSETIEQPIDNDEIESTLSRRAQGIDAIAALCNLSDAKKEALREFVEKASKAVEEESKLKEDFQIGSLEKIEDKEWRKSFHDCVHQWFPSELESVFRFKEAEPSASYFSLQAGKGKRNNKPNSLIRFVCFKDNMTTPEAVREISKACKVNSKSICFSGTKDKRGATTQFMTIRNVTSAQLSSVNKRNYGGKTLKVGTFSWADEPLTLGSLWGNEFTMCIRKMEIEDPAHPNQTKAPTKEEIAERIEALKATGFINYFGMQRFGTYSESTYKVGIEFLKGDVWKAIQAVLTSRTSSDDNYKSIIDECLETGDFNLAISRVNRRFYQDEWNVLSSLAKNPGDYLGAYNRIPFTIRSMYIHSFQSYIWNWMVTKRIEKYGITPVVGDLVYAEGSTSESSAKDAKVTYITEENIDKYTIEDVIMPLPGTSVEFPKHDINADKYIELMEADGVRLEHFSNFETDYHLYGGYRHILVLPQNVTYEMNVYTDYTLPLIRTDIQIAKKEELPLQPPASSADEEKTALVISFSLPSSAYATMCIRELMHLSSTLKWDELNEKE